MGLGFRVEGLGLFQGSGVIGLWDLWAYRSANPRTLNSLCRPGLVAQTSTKDSLVSHIEKLPTKILP